MTVPLTVTKIVIGAYASKLVRERDETKDMTLDIIDSRTVDADREEVVIPVIEESVHVEKREIKTGRVRLIKTVREHVELVDEPLLRTDVQVKRIPINLIVESAPPVRTEGDTTIISVVEEVLVLEKRLMVTEEVHVTKLQSQFHDPQTVTLRSEEIAVERITM